MNKRKTSNTISETKYDTVYLKYTITATTKPRFKRAAVARLGLPDFAELAFVDFV